MSKIILQDDKYYFVDNAGNETECKVWIETSKKSEKHPEGKPWIKLPKDNDTNRQYFSEDLFLETAVDGEVEVEVKTSAPRILGSTGVKKNIVKYLSEAEAAEYEEMVNAAVEAYKDAKANSKKKKLEDMSAEELEAYIEALQSGKTFTASTNGPKSFMDMFSEDEYNRYNELLAIAQENKANAPRAKRGPLTDEEKAVRKAKRVQSTISKAEALLAALRANN